MWSEIWLGLVPMYKKNQVWDLFVNIIYFFIEFRYMQLNIKSYFLRVLVMYQMTFYLALFEWPLRGSADYHLDNLLAKPLKETLTG